MTELVIVLGAATLILLIAFIAVAKRLNQMYEEYEAAHRSNAALKNVIRSLERENKNLRDRVYVTDDSRSITTLKLKLLIMQEEIDNLQAQLGKQKVLLRQKWEASKK